MDVLGFVRSFASHNPWTFVVGPTLLVWVLQVILRGYRHRRFYRNLPGPPHSFLWGHLKVLGEVSAKFPPNTHPQAIYTEIARKYQLEGVFYIDLWPIAFSSVVLTDPSLMDEVAVRRANNQHPMSEVFLAPILGPNVIATANGAIWKRLHNAMAPAFSWSHIRNLTTVMVEEISLFRDGLDKYAKTGEVFSAEELSAKLIFDIIGRIVFNFRLHAQTTPSPYLNDLREMLELAHGQTDLIASYNPIARVTNWWRRRKVLGRLHPLILGKVHDRLELLLTEGITPSRANPNSILDLMLREFVLSSESYELPMKKDKMRLSPEDSETFLTNIKGLLLGGHGTTTDTFCFIIMLLSKTPSVREKLRQEHNDVFGKDLNDTIKSLLDTPERLQDLPYTEAVIKETLRLFPVGFGIREAPTGSQVTFQDKTFAVDGHQGIMLNGHDVHYNPELFPDTCVFLPERWLDTDGGVPRSHFRSFGRGKRACLGQPLAMNELKVIMVMVMRDYEFDCAGLKPNSKPRVSHTNLDTIYGDVIFQELGIEARPRGGMMMTVKKLKNEGFYKVSS